MTGRQAWWSSWVWPRAPRGLAQLLTLALFLAGARGTAQQAASLPASLEPLFTEGVEAQKAGRLDAAEQAFLQVLSKGGNVAFVHNNLGIVYQMRGDHARAIVQFREAIRLQPTYAAPHLLLGASLLALRQVPEAIRALERAVKLQPNERQARLELAKAYERGEDFRGVVEQFRALRELAPQEPEYAYQLGNAYLKLASWCAREMVRLNPRSARVYQMLGENYRHQAGRIDLAIRAFQRAAQADPRLPEIHLALAEIYLRQGKSAEARREIEQELALVPESAAALALKKKLDAGTSPSQ